MSDTPVVIIGAGFAGLALALALHKHRIRCVIYELRDKNYSKGGNIGLAPNALRVLDHLGVFDSIRDQGYNYEELYFDNGRGDLLGTFWNGSKEAYNYRAIRIHRVIVRNALIEEVERCQIPIQWNHKCVGIVEETPNHIIIELQEGFHVDAQYVIGCDGIHSCIRRYIATGTDPTFSGLMGIMGNVDKSKLDLNVAESMKLPCMLFGSTGSFAIMPSNYSGTEMGYFATIQSPDLGSPSAWNQLDSDKDRCRKFLVDRFLHEGSCYPQLVKDLVRLTPNDTLTNWPFFSVPHLETFRSPQGRAILIGDAAHAIPPTGGQGAAMALEDAETLAYTISAALARTKSLMNADVLDFFAAWEAHRMARLTKVIEFTTKNGDLRKSSPHFYEQAAKEWLMWLKFKWMGKEGGAQWMYGYNAESVLGVLPDI